MSVLEDRSFKVYRGSEYLQHKEKHHQILQIKQVLHLEMESKPRFYYQ